jgi:hypothetical protein
VECGLGELVGEQAEAGDVGRPARSRRSNSPKVIFSASPGSAPSMKTGPVTGLTRVKSRVATSAAVLPAWKWPLPASLHSKRSVAPGAIVSTGGMELSQP